MPIWDQGRWGMGRGTSVGWWRLEKHWLCSSYFPGWYVTKKSNLVKNKAHLAWWGLSCLASRRYSRFLWSVMTSNWWFAPSSQCLHSFQGKLDGQELTITDVVILLHRGQLLWGEGTWNLYWLLWYFSVTSHSSITLALSQVWQSFLWHSLLQVWQWSVCSVPSEVEYISCVWSSGAIVKQCCHDVSFLCHTGHKKDYEPS